MDINDQAWGIGFRRELGDESNPTWAIVLGGTSNALHLVDPLNAGTDYNLSADSTPALYIHGSAAAVTEYVKIFTDETDAHLNVVGANLDVDVPANSQVAIQVNNTDEYTFNSASASFNNNTLGSVGNVTMTGGTISGTSLRIDSATDIAIGGTACWSAAGTGTVLFSVQGPAAVGSVACVDWMVVKDHNGSTFYIPAFAA